jgi:hypothetical protein
VTTLSEAALLFAGLMHDVDHSGRNNDFMKKSLHPLSILYNDNSVKAYDQILENHHVATAFRLLKQSDTNIFENMEPSEFPLFREYVIHGILSTDMMLHKGMMTGIQLKLDQDRFTPNESIVSCLSQRMTPSHFSKCLGFSCTQQTCTRPPSRKK